MKELQRAVRQYQHNDCSGLVMGYDEAETNRVVSDLLRERNELAAQVERLRGAWESVKATDWDEPIEEVLAETTAQSLEAVKREAAGDAINRFIGCIDVEMQYNEKVIDAIPLALRSYNSTL